MPAAYAVAGALVFYWIVDRLWTVPFGILVKGAVIGGLYSMIAVGIALVYRANRIINFAQGDMGGVPGEPCRAADRRVRLALPGRHRRRVWSVASLLGVVIEFVIIRRFAKSPRLVLTVATIGIAQLLTFGEIYMPQAFHATTPPQSFPSPFNWGSPSARCGSRATTCSRS